MRKCHFYLAILRKLFDFEIYQYQMVSILENRFAKSAILDCLLDTSYLNLFHEKNNSTKQEVKVGSIGDRDISRGTFDMFARLYVDTS